MRPWCDPGRQRYERHGKESHSNSGWERPVAALALNKMHSSTTLCIYTCVQTVRLFCTCTEYQSVRAARTSKKCATLLWRRRSHLPLAEPFCLCLTSEPEPALRPPPPPSPARPANCQISYPTNSPRICKLVWTGMPPMGTARQQRRQRRYITLRGAKKKMKKKTEKNLQIVFWGQAICNSCATIASSNSLRPRIVDYSILSHHTTPSPRCSGVIRVINTCPGFS